MSKSVKSTLVLVCICAAIALLLALTNFVTAPIIEQKQAEAANAALLEVMPNGKDFQKVDLSSYTLPATVTAAYSEAGGGYVFTLVTTGYSSGFTIVCGVNADGTVSGTKCLSSAETLGYEKTYGENMVGKNSETVDEVATIAGATKTTAAYRNAVKDALNAAVILGGGSVDIRTEEEILADNLNAALPAGEGAFTKRFFTEVTEGITAVYTADNGAGYVVVVDEQFIGVDAESKVLSEVDEATAAHVTAQLAILTASTLETVDLTAYTGIHKNVVSAQKTSGGNYVLEVKGAGYGIMGGDEYHPASGQYIMIRVSITKDGQIIDCLTVSQEETKNLGDACADESFYGQFDGKTADTYEDVDAISGATLTTNGYKQAIGRAFDAVVILEGGANE